MRRESTGRMSFIKIGHFVAPEEMISASNCYNWYEKMRDYSPIYYDRKRRCWDIFRYNDVKNVLANHKIFSSNRSKDKIDNLVSMDPPEHKKFRSLASKDFGHQSIQRMDSLIHEIIEQTLQQVTDYRQVDFSQSIAYRIPIMVIMRLLGIPEHFYEKIKEVIRNSLGRSQSTGNPLKKELQKIKKAILDANLIFEQIIEERLKNPQDDLISKLLHQHREEIDKFQLRDFFRSILVAGSETTVHLTGNAIYHFLKKPGVLEQLRDKPALFPSAIEEVLRYSPSVQCVNRFATEDVILGEHTIFKGQEVVVWIGSANRDEEIFDRANEFQIDRSPNPHISFGQGIHYCLGSSLARMEANIILTKIIEQFPKIKLSDTIKPATNTNFVFQGFEHLYVDFV